MCKRELRGKAIVLWSRSRRAQFNRGKLSYGQNEGEETCFAKTKANQGASAAVRIQAGTRSRGQQRTKRNEKNVLPQNHS